MFSMLRRGHGGILLIAIQIQSLFGLLSPSFICVNMCVVGVPGFKTGSPKKTGAFVFFCFVSFLIHGKTNHSMYWSGFFWPHAFQGSWFQKGNRHTNGCNPLWQSSDSAKFSAWYVIKYQMCFVSAIPSAKSIWPKLLSGKCCNICWKVTHQNLYTCQVDSLINFNLICKG